MCGRITQHIEIVDIAAEWRAEVDGAPDWSPSYNLAPTQRAAVLGQRGGARVLRAMTWGLVPMWARDREMGAKCINARAETLAVKPAFRVAFAKRRCVVPVTGWYEWRREGGVKVPHWFHPARGRTLPLAALWELWRDPLDGSELRTFAIVTTEPNAVAAAVHDRMPVVLADADVDRWLSPDARGADCAALLRPCDQALLEVWPVDRRVGNVRVDEPGLIARAA